MTRTPTPDAAGSRQVERRARLRRGRGAERLAAALLLLKGYRVLARRLRTPHGEIDLIAVRGRRLAFVEVKRRATLADAEASLTPRQAGRIARAADHWLARNKAFQEHEIGLDAVLIVPRHWPRHLLHVLG